MKKEIAITALVPMMLMATSCEKKETFEPTIEKYTVAFDRDGIVGNAVDLGLSVMWADHNVDAVENTDNGNYYVWGGVVNSDTCLWSNYRFSSGRDIPELTKYCSMARFGLDGFVDEIAQMEQEDDAANAMWGDGWRLPTKKEWQELLDKCEWSWTALGSTTMPIYGYMVKAKSGNASIFLPASGYLNNNKRYNKNILGYYWSANFEDEEPQNGNFLHISKEYARIDRAARHYGMSIRPVRAKE